MNVAVGRVRLHLPENASLKGKRQVVKSIIARVKNRYNVAIAEVEDMELWQSAVLGLACVGNGAGHVREMLANVIKFIENSRVEAEVVDYEVEVVSAL